ncbi:MAG: helix-turn-helix transcriptional regulator [Dehalococcoidales bacterium]|nr:helix-turn-helix transcriptional regulator [Dehalococcoidales bacterium]
MINRVNSQNLGMQLKQRRLMVPLTLRRMAALSGISSSHLGRIERGERFPSALVLQRIARPLGINESELFLLAGYLSPPMAGVEEEKSRYGAGQLDPYVTRTLSQEPAEVQRTVIGILSILKSIALTMK